MVHRLGTVVMKLWYETPYTKQAQQLSERLAERGVQIDLQCTDKINAKFLRLHPELALVVDDLGLSLTAQGMRMQPDWKAETGRLKRASLKSEMLARACQANDSPTLIDATAGLGHDTLLMAKFGAKIVLVERHPILYTLLESAYEQAQQDIFLANIVKNITLIFEDSAKYLQQTSPVDVVYLDPMFPQREKTAQVKKQMQLLHMLLPEDGEMDLGDELLLHAKKVAKRVVVKRPRYAVFLNNDTPQHQWLGDACRFDGYFQ